MLEPLHIVGLIETRNFLRHREHGIFEAWLIRNRPHRADLHVLRVLGEQARIGRCVAGQNLRMRKFHLNALGKLADSLVFQSTVNELLILYTQTDENKKKTRSINAFERNSVTFFHRK